MKLFFRALLPILFIIKSPVLFGQFTDITPDSLPGVYDGDISLGDYDNDGDLDILATGLFAKDQFITYVFKNNEGVFEKGAIQPDSLPGVAEGKAEWGDVNGDGLLDIFIAGRSGPWSEEKGKVLIYYNKGNDIFELASNTGLPELARTDATLVDFNNDNTLDVLLTGRITENEDEHYFQAALYANNGEGKFTEVHVFNKLFKHYYPNLITSSVDFNNDGYSDFLINQSKPGEALKIHLNQGGGKKFILNHSPVNSSFYQVEPKWGDFNNDMLIDLVSSPNIKTRVVPNLDIFFLLSPVQEELFSKLYDGEFEWGDYDADGDLDLLIAGENNGYGEPVSVTTSLYENENGIFGQVNSPNLIALKDNSVAWGDLDNDGDLDLVMTGKTLEDELTIKIYQNDLNENVFTENSKPLPPINLSDSVGGNDVFFKWEAQDDSETPKKGLTFNIFALSEDSTIFFGPPMADMKTGNRQVARAGIINGGLNQWILRDLPNGKYTWGVQAIDGSYEGSLFTLGDTFEIDIKLPTNLKLVAKTSNLIEGTWLDNSDVEEGYNLERKGPKDKDYLLISGLPPNSTSFKDYDIEENATYHYRITIKNDNGKSGFLGDSIKSLKSSNKVIENLLPEYFQISSDWVDFDKDGHLNGIVIGNKHNDSTHTYSVHTELYTLDSNFQLIKSLSLPSIPDIQPHLLLDHLTSNWVDIDADGDFDISTTGGHEDSTLVFYENVNNQNFKVKYNLGIPTLRKNGLAWGDCDNDGDLDLFLSGKLKDSDNPYPIASIFINEGNFQFSKLGNIELIGLDYPEANWVDLNNDGFKDLIYSGSLFHQSTNGGGRTEKLVKIYINNGDLSFTEYVDKEAKTWANYSVGDYDLDGLPDFLIQKYDYSTKVYDFETVIYKNLGNFQFEKQEKNYFTFLASTRPSGNTADWCDLNNDGYLDFIISGSWETKGFNDYYLTKTFLNKKDNSFSEIIDTGINGGGGQFKIMDFDNDNDIDIFNPNIKSVQFLGNYSYKRNGFANFYSGNLGLNKFQKNTAPIPPSDLIHQQLGNQIVLSWSGATDAQSQVSSLTYNLEIRKGDSILWSSQSLDNGSQLLPGPGNMGHNTNITIDSLTTGKYNWRIQTIDPSYGASPFSEWKELEVKKQFKISGSLLTESRDPVNQVTIEVYQTSNDSTNLVKSISLTNANTFEFEGEENSKFILKAIPDSEKYPNLLPTYFGGALLFTEAEVIELTEDKSVTITLLEKAGEQTGNSTIEGLALETEGNEGGRLTQGFATEGTPISDLPVYLLNKESALVGLDTTDSNGLFQFENINSGTYQLAADYNYKPISLSNALFEITEDGQSLQLSLLVGDSLSVEITSITGLKDFEPIEGVTIYPNPVENVIQVNIQNQINGNYQLEILDITGKSLLKESFKKSTQNMVESIDLAELTKGIYFLKISKGNTLVVKRLVKG